MSMFVLTLTGFAGSHGHPGFLTAAAEGAARTFTNAVPAQRQGCRDAPSRVLKFDPLVGALQIDMQRLAQPVRVIPHAAEHRELDDLLLA